MLMSLLLKKL